MEMVQPEMILGLGAFILFGVMWVVLPSRLHKKHEAEEE
jgi:hypothetical protein